MAKRGKDKTHPWRQSPQEYKAQHEYFPDWAANYYESSGELQEIASEFVSKYSSQIQAGEVTVDEVQKKAFEVIQARYIQPESPNQSEQKLQAIEAELDEVREAMKYASGMRHAALMKKRIELGNRHGEILDPLIKSGELRPRVDSDVRHMTITGDTANSFLSPSKPKPPYQGDTSGSGPEPPDLPPPAKYEDYGAK